MKVAVFSLYRHRPLFRLPFLDLIPILQYMQTDAEKSNIMASHHLHFIAPISCPGLEEELIRLAICHRDDQKQGSGCK